MEKSTSTTSGLHTISISSAITIGFVALPSLSSATVAGGSGSLALRQVACRAKQARFGAIDEVDEMVEIEEMEDAREEREKSENIDSGLDLEDAALVIDGRRDVKG